MTFDIAGFERSDCQWELDLQISKILNTTPIYAQTRTHIHSYYSFNAIPYLYGIVILKWSSKLGLEEPHGNPQPQAIHSSDAAANNQLLLCMQMKRPFIIYISFTLAMLQEHCSTCSRFLLKLRAGIDGLLRGLEVALFTSDAARIIARILLDYGRQLSSAVGANAGNVVTALEHSAHGPSVGCQIIFIIVCFHL
uniref:Uncharacterized protein n=1 Tax=Glossina palpalis gambiensis TaxID=67801 RepID=A0A1B0BIY2_9MUSC